MYYISNYANFNEDNRKRNIGLGLGGLAVVGLGGAALLASRGKSGASVTSEAIPSSVKSKYSTQTKAPKVPEDPIEKELELLKQEQLQKPQKKYELKPPYEKPPILDDSTLKTRKEFVVGVNEKQKEISRKFREIRPGDVRSYVVKQGEKQDSLAQTILDSDRVKDAELNLEVAKASKNKKEIDRSQRILDDEIIQQAVRTTPPTLPTVSPATKSRGSSGVRGKAEEYVKLSDENRLSFREI